MLVPAANVVALLVHRAFPAGRLPPYDFSFRMEEIRGLIRITSAHRGVIDGQP